MQNCSKATHVVCKAESIAKYIGLNLHLVSVSMYYVSFPKGSLPVHPIYVTKREVDGFDVQPMWFMSARDGCLLRCVQYSADLARDVSSLLLEWKTQEHNITNVGYFQTSPLQRQIPKSCLMAMNKFSLTVLTEIHGCCCRIFSCRCKKGKRKLLLQRQEFVVDVDLRTR